MTGFGEDMGPLPYKLFVSRIPPKWTEKLMMEHFTHLGFGVERVELFTGKREDSSRPARSKRGFGNICYAKIFFKRKF